MQIHWIKAQAPRRVLALVKHLGIDAELIETDPRTGAMKSPAYTALNPNQKAPTLVDGQVVLWESSAIMAYLCIKAKSDMWPAHNPAEQVDVLRWLSWSDAHWSPAVAPFYFEHIVKSTFGIGPADTGSLQGKVADFQRFAKVLNEHLAHNDYAACGRLTIADFQLASMAAYWRESQMPMAEFAHIVRWLDRLMEIPAWAQPWPAPYAGM
jgi:glutathione S-transferase